MARILVVEDELVIQHVLREILTPEGHAIAFAGSIAEARKLIASMPAIDVAFIDKNLPDGSGLDLGKELVAAHGSTNWIVMTALATLESAITALQAGAYDYLQKPFADVQKLVTLVQHASEHAAFRRERDLLLQRLMDSEARYSRALEGTRDGIWDWDFQTGEMFFSARWKTMVGAEQEVARTPEDWLGRVHPEDVERLKAAIAHHQGGTEPHFECEYRIYDKKRGAYRWMLARGMAIRDGSGAAERMTGSQTDIHDRKMAEEQLLYDARHDALTGLPNRAVLADRMGQLLERKRRHPDYEFAVLYVDLDRFKMINDGLGHSLGDALLCAVARRLEACVRTGDTVTRAGGDEFVILLDGTLGSDGALVVANRILENLGQPFKIGDEEVYSGATVGIALGSADYVRPEDLQRDADTAMYRAKSAGGGTHSVFNPRMHTRAVETLALHNALRQALDRHEFRVHYQPIVSVAKRRILGFEALVRWQHPERGMVSPGEFIPIAEETGLILPLGAWVLEKACRQLQTWQRKFPREQPLSMSVNISGRQLRQQSLVEQMQSLLRDTGLDPSSLGIELTESILMESVEHSGRMLALLKALGVRLHLDDFGTGFSSLSYLHRFPIDSLKIDRSFVHQLPKGGSNQAIVRAILTLAKSLNMGVVAEGVETEEQLQVLRDLDCQYAQGYLFARPGDEATMETLLELEGVAARVTA